MVKSWFWGRFSLVKFTKWQGQIWQCASLLKNCCSLLKKSDFPLNLYLQWYLRELNGTFYNWKNWQCVKIDKLCLFVSKFLPHYKFRFSPSTVHHQKNRFSTKLCVMKTSDFPLNWYLHFKVVWALSGLLYWGGPTARVRKEA